MDKFVFALDGVLRLRQRMELLRQRDLSAATLRVRGLELQVRDLDRQVRDCAAEVRRSHLTGRLDVGFLRHQREYLEAMRTRAAEIAREITAGQIEAEKARRAMEDEMRQRKVIEKLRQRQFERWSGEQRRAEIEQADDAAARGSRA